MDEKDLELLCALHEHGSVTRAATSVFITQSALTRRLQSLEQELGAELVIRSRQGVRLTPAGEIAVHSAKQALRILCDMREQIDAQRGEICGSLRLGVSVNYAAYRLPELLSAFHKQYPKVRIQLTTGHSRNLYEHLCSGQLDAAILRGDFSWDDNRFLIAQEHMCVICSKDYAYTPLSQYPYIGRETDSAMSQLMSRWLREQGLERLQPELHVDSLTACMALAGRGLGWAIVPEIGLHDFRGEIRRCSFEDGQPFLRKTWLLSSRGAAQLPQVHVFTEFIRQNA